jgi:hypothetical protein
VSDRKGYPHIGAWLEVDDENKKVEYQVDSKWMKNASDEERKNTLEKLTLLANVYQRAGYAVFGLLKKVFEKNNRSS